MRTIPARTEDETTVTAEGPVVPPEEQQRDADARIAAEVADISETAEAVITAKTKLPPSVRERVEELFSQALTAQKTAEDAGRNWAKTREDKRNLVELAGLLFEYANVVPELQQRTGNRITAAAVRKFLRTHTSVSVVEERVMTILRDNLIAVQASEPNKRRDFDANQKRYIVSLMRLLRKRGLGTESLHALLGELKLQLAIVYTRSWKQHVEEEDGTPRLTAEIIPEVFERAVRELTLPQEEESQSEEETTAVPEPAASQPREESTALAQPSHQASEVRDDAIIARIVAQNECIIQKLNLLMANVAAVQDLLRAPAVANTETPAPPKQVQEERQRIVLTGNQIQLSPDTRGKITITELQLDGES